MKRRCDVIESKITLKGQHNATKSPFSPLHIYSNFIKFNYYWEYSFAPEARGGGVSKLSSQC